jgi:hypothetical protein
VRWLSSKHDVNVPGEGFGGGGGFDAAPIKHLSPNTDPWAVNPMVSCPKTHVFPLARPTELPQAKYEGPTHSLQFSISI